MDEAALTQLPNGSVLMTSRNFYAKSSGKQGARIVSIGQAHRGVIPGSGQGPRLFARSDDGGAHWAANWTAWDLPDPYCEGALLSDAQHGLFFGNPSNGRYRVNYSIHASLDGGHTWPLSEVVYSGGAAYSDLAFTRNGSIAVLFEKDNYNTVSFTVVPPLRGWQTKRYVGRTTRDQEM